MTAATSRPYITEEEYLALDRASTTKHEYFHGRIYAMTGAKEPHNLINGNTLASLHSQLRRKPCRIYASDMRVKVTKTGLNTFPDIVIICGQPEFTDSTRDTVTNPVVIIEILSDSTERYDRGMKFQNYRTLDSLRDYILIAQDHRHIEHFSRQDGGLWVLHEAIGDTDIINILSVECTLNVEDVYEKVEFDQEAPEITREILTREEE